MLGFLFVVAVLNLAVGFVLAADLGRRHRALVTACEALEAARASQDEPSSQEETPEPDAAAPPDGAASAESRLLDAAAQAEPSEAASGTSATAEVAAPEKSAQITAAEEAVLANSPRQRTVANLQNEVDRYEEKLHDADAQLRQYAEPPESEEIDAFLAALKEASSDFLKNRIEFQQVFEETHRDIKEFGSQCAAVRAAVDNQTSQIESTNRAIASLAPESDAGDKCRVAAAETSKLLVANHQLRDVLDEARLEIARVEQTLDALPTLDLETGVSSRASLETAIQTWWQKDPHRLLKLTVVLFDIDRFSHLNEQHGLQTGNAILKALGALLQHDLGTQGSVARFAGQRFMLLLPEKDIRNATQQAERLRQTIETTTFCRGTQKVQITVSCAVTEATSGDSTQTLFDRAEETLREAKRYGRNRTFLHEGKYPAPVVPPNLPAQDRIIDI